jgi:hypothetical protein
MSDKSLGNLRKVDLYMLMILIVVKNQNKKVFNATDIHKEVGSPYFNQVTGLSTEKEIRAKIRGAKINANVITAFDGKTELMTVPDIMFDAINNGNFITKDNTLYFDFTTDKYAEAFDKWKKISGINKSIYVKKDCFINLYIEKLKETINLRELPKGKGNKVPDIGLGSVGPASKIYVYNDEYDNLKGIVADKLYISFEEMYDQEYNLKNNDLWNKIKKTQIIIKSIETYGYDKIKNDFFKHLKKCI